MVPCYLPDRQRPGVNTTRRTLSTRKSFTQSYHHGTPLSPGPVDAALPTS